MLSFGWCVWDLPALLVLLASIATLFIDGHKLRKREQELEEELARRSADRAAGH